MRLLDQLAQSRSPMLLELDSAPRNPLAVTGPADYAGRVSDCPLRYVLSDDLTHAAAHLAFAEGDRLAGCLDLVRIPATRLWVEWSDEIHRKAMYETGAAPTLDAEARGRRAGVFLEATSCGRVAVARTFWGHAADTGPSAVVLSPIETHLDLRDAKRPGAGADALLRGNFARIADPLDPAMETLLDCARFRFDASWNAYYEMAARDAQSQLAAVNGSLAAVARDVPLLLAFFLLLDAHDATSSARVDRATVNEKRRRLGHAPLLDHIEVRASLERLATTMDADHGHGERRAPRLHHVRGHLVRRGDRVFWRSPHVRGRASLGSIRTRTVCLAFGRRQSPQERRH